MGLTQREAEVLFWVAKDKSNGEIAKTLDCCEGTVRKHLEHLYKKLEVQTRMGAVMTAMERLGLLRA
jgi:DNA-binding CsgD family transcriptional regulator